MLVLSAALVLDCRCRSSGRPGSGLRLGYVAVNCVETRQSAGESANTCRWSLIFTLHWCRGGNSLVDEYNGLAESREGSKNWKSSETLPRIPKSLVSRIAVASAAPFSVTLLVFLTGCSGVACPET